MDTEELSTETYRGIINEADNFHSDLALQFGLIASSCKNEKEYLRESEILIKEIQQLNKSTLSDIFFDSPPDIQALRLILKKILTNISEIQKIPENKRRYNF